MQANDNVSEKGECAQREIGSEVALDCLFVKLSQLTKYLWARLVLFFAVPPVLMVILPALGAYFNDERFRKHIMGEGSFWPIIVAALIVFAVPAGLLYFLARKQARAQRVSMDRISVSLDSGVFFKRRISILYDQITDVTMSQGPLQSLFGIWELRIHTPGSPDEVSEYRGYDKTASALGLSDPDKARNLLLSARQRAKGK